MECEHRYHFIEIEKENESYMVDNPDGTSTVKTKKRQKRLSKFICEKCGFINKVEVKI